MESSGRQAEKKQRQLGKSEECQPASWVSDCFKEEVSHNGNPSSGDKDPGGNMAPPPEVVMRSLASPLGEQNIL